MKTTNWKKRLLSLALSLCLLGAGAFQTTALCKDTSNKAASKKAFEKVLNNKDKTFKIGEKKYKRKNYKYYKMIDINKDGTYEMLLSTEKGEFITGTGKALLLTYTDGKVKAVKAFASLGGMTLYTNNKRLVYYYRGAGEGHMRIYKLTSENKLKRTCSLDRYQGYHYDTEDPKAYYFHNGDRCSKKELVKLWEKYQSGPIKYKKIK